MAIHPKTSIGSVHLVVRDLGHSVRFYEQRIGFSVRDLGDGVVGLGAGGPDLVVLWERRDAPRARGTTGLYHFAVLVPNRWTLAKVLEHLANKATPMTGVADHGVSEALYLQDPEGNGIEIYRDRPRIEWPTQDGHLQLVNAPLDTHDLHAELTRNAPREWSGLPPGTTIGHIHLCVANLDAAEDFYVAILGFERMQRYGDTATFLSAGGYHHHIGLNTWAGVGAPPPPPGAAGLRFYVVRLPNRAECEELIAHVRSRSIQVEEVDGGYLLADPSGNRIVLQGEPQQMIRSDR